MATRTRSSPSHPTRAAMTPNGVAGDDERPRRAGNSSTRIPRGCPARQDDVHIVDMDAAYPFVPDGERSPGTLGEVLYASPSRPPVSEAEWIALVQAVAAG